MRAVWSDQHRYELWLRIEILACEAWAEIGRIPASALPKIRNATFDAGRIASLEERVGHDVIAFLTDVNASIGQPEARYVHLGMTSQDLNDTAMAVQLLESSHLIASDLGNVRDAAAELAVRHRKTLMAGRTHGIVAEPITFGFKVAGWVAELDRVRVRLERATEEAAVGRICGAVGTHATVDPRVEEHVCKALGLRADVVSTQVVARDVHAAFMAALASVAGALERIATEIRHLQRSEVGEVFEPFGKEQKGSSAMPHKRNPITSERLSGLARVIRGNSMVALENVALWHERDISHSSAERIILPDSCILLDFMLFELRNLVERLQVYPERMRQNLEVTKGLYFSQSILLALTRAGAERKTAYEAVQRAAMKTWKGEGSFAENVKAEPEITAKLSAEEIDRLCSLDVHFQHVDETFKALGLE